MEEIQKDRSSRILRGMLGNRFLPIKTERDYLEKQCSSAV
jgi:hypothetical protein